MTSEDLHQAYYSKCEHFLDKFLQQVEPLISLVTNFGFDILLCVLKSFEMLLNVVKRC